MLGGRIALLDTSHITLELWAHTGGDSLLGGRDVPAGSAEGVGRSVPKGAPWPRAALTACTRGAFSSRTHRCVSAGPYRRIRLQSWSGPQHQHTFPHHAFPLGAAAGALSWWLARWVGWKPPVVRKLVGIYAFGHPVTYFGCGHELLFFRTMVWSAETILALAWDCLFQCRFGFSGGAPNRSLRHGATASRRNSRDSGIVWVAFTGGAMWPTSRRRRWIGFHPGSVGAASVCSLGTFSCRVGSILVFSSGRGEVVPRRDGALCVT